MMYDTCYISHIEGAVTTLLCCGVSALIGIGPQFSQCPTVLHMSCRLHFIFGCEKTSFWHRACLVLCLVLISSCNSGKADAQPEGNCVSQLRKCILEDPPVGRVGGFSIEMEPLSPLPLQKRYDTLRNRVDEMCFVRIHMRAPMLMNMDEDESEDGPREWLMMEKGKGCS